jgi:hypothetical protein
MKLPFQLSSRFPLAGLAAALLALASSAQATTINWGTYINPANYLFDSTGANLDDDYFFELGSFGTFIPTSGNMSDWMTNWKPFDRAYAPPASGWNSSAGIVAHSAVLEVDFTTSNTELSQANLFNLGEQAYIWVYSDTLGNPNPVPTLGTSFQWALVTNNSTDGTPADDWLFPAPSGHVNTTLDWRIEDATYTPFGGLNNVEGPGDFTNTPADFILQTHTAPIPEVGSSLLIGCAGLSFLLRRRRHT